MTAIAQQINLLVDDLAPRREYLTFAHAAALCLVVVVGLTSITVVSAFRLAGLHTESASASGQFTELARTTQELKRTAAVEVDSALLARVEALRADRAARLALVDVVGTTAGARTRGFSEYLSELARNEEPRIWLTRMRFESVGARVELEGTTLDPLHVPAMLKLLSQGDRFAGHRFDEFEIVRQSGGDLQFLITGPAVERQK